VLAQRGVKEIGVVNVLSADTDFTAAATQGKAENPDLIMIWATQIPAAGIISALRQRGFEKTIAATDAIATNAVFKKTGEPLAGVVFPVIFTADLPSTPAAQAFVNNFEGKWKEAPDTYAAQGYTAIHLLAQAMKAVDGPPSREAMASQLSKITALTPDVFGGIALIDGQAEVANSLVATWTKDGKIRAWDGK
jgi:ABC-type branched-subunit amino acid transport system substrate-binding protein